MVNTRTLDHIIYLTPPGTLKETSQQFRELGFNVLDGGAHADGFTENALVIFADGVYLELLSFTQPADKHHRWASKSPGWIDYAFLGNGSRSDTISETINQRARKDGSGVLYEPEQEGGRYLSDGKLIKWLISSPRQEKEGITGAPFFCGDVTPRYLRVPKDPPANVQHPSGTIGIAYLRILAQPASFYAVSNQLKIVLGHDPIISMESESIWSLDTTDDNHPQFPRLILNIPNNVEEMTAIGDSITQIYEVGFRIRKGSKKGETSTTYGRIAWVEDEIDGLTTS